MSGTLPRGAVMVCGTASDVGKSRVVTGLCRALARRGAKVAPFKAQNMSLNSTVTRDGHEIARSQAVQAAAARVEADVLMGPVLLKPMGERKSQLVVMGHSKGEVAFGASWSPERLMATVVQPALAELRKRNDFVVVEGAGGAAEINLLHADIANLPLARLTGVPALLLGDIEKGGVFASLFGTVALLPDDLRAQLRGFAINKFRGDEELLHPGIAELERRLGLPCLGVLPHLGELAVDEEDSLALASPPAGPEPSAALDIAVLRLPRLSNFTDFAPLVLENSVSVRYVAHPAALADPDLIILPGSKATVNDLAWLRAAGFPALIEAARRRGTALLGICAGYQMLGTDILDEVESRAGYARGLGYLSVSTVFEDEKITLWRQGKAVSGETVSGFELHHGRPVPQDDARSWLWLDTPDGPEPEGIADPEKGVWATSVHGLLENDALRTSFLSEVASRRGKCFKPGSVNFGAAREQMIDRLADAVESHLDMASICSFASEAAER